MMFSRNKVVVGRYAGLGCEPIETQQRLSAADKME